jgi:transforming growth factor-beta-induced protein
MKTLVWLFMTVAAMAIASVGCSDKPRPDRKSADVADVADVTAQTPADDLPEPAPDMEAPAEVPAPPEDSEPKRPVPQPEVPVQEEPTEPESAVMDEAEEESEPPAQPADLVDTAIASGEFETLVAAVQAAGLVDTLKGAGPFTLFAPTDEAFGKVDADQLSQLLEPANRDQLIAILTYHVVPGRVLAADVAQLTTAQTVQGSPLAIVADETAVKVGQATVIVKDVICANGVIHVIDAVLMPPSPPGEPEPEMEPGSEESEPVAEPEEPAAPELKDLVDTAREAGRFKTLLAAVEAAGLVETAKGVGPFTVFAPTDEAFAKIEAATLEELLLPENKDQLAGILSYHVVPAKLLAADVVAMTTATTLQGADLPIVVDGDTVTVGGARVVSTDILCSNGVIHVIDTVLLPPEG